MRAQRLVQAAGKTSQRIPTGIVRFNGIRYRYTHPAEQVPDQVERGDISRKHLRFEHTIDVAPHLIEGNEAVTHDRFLNYSAQSRRHDVVTRVLMFKIPD